MKGVISGGKTTMKGVILAGGLATRLRPLTLVTNKHLLPIYNKPMIFYPLEAMVKAGILEVLIVTGPEHAGAFLNLLKGGDEFDLKLTYEIQQEPGGIAQGISLAKSFADEQFFMHQCRHFLAGMIMFGHQI